MTGITLLLAMSSIGVKWGWEPVDGGIRYIIQIEPQMVDSFAAGQDILSDLPRSTQPIRGYKIMVGTAPLPNEGVLPTPPDAGPRFPTALTPPMEPSAATKPELTETPPANEVFAPASSPTASTSLKPTMEPPSPSDHLSYPSAAESKSPAEPHWWPLTFALLALFVSLGTNLYLGLISWSFRNRCVELLARLKGA